MTIEKTIQSVINDAVEELTLGARKVARGVNEACQSVGDDVQQVGDDARQVLGMSICVPTLPQDARDSVERRVQLEEARALYRYQTPAFLPPLVNTAGVPAGEALSAAYQAELLPVITDIAVNEVRAAGFYFADHPERHPNLEAIPAYLEQAAGRLGPTTLLKDMMDYLLDGHVARLHSVDSFKGLWQTLQPPATVDQHDDDLLFGYQRLAGANPTLIQRIDAVPDNFPVTDAMLAGCAPGFTSLEATAKEGRLYLVDYSILDGIPGGEVFGCPKYLAAPLALFVWQPGGAGGGALRPVAIQLAQTPDPEKAPVFTPRDGIKWTIAKLYVQNADGVQLQTIAHLQHCHLTVEPIILPTMRQLAANHPVYVLLKPHFQFTIAINDNSRTSLVTPRGVVDSILSPDLEKGTYELVRRAHKEWSFREAMPDRVFAARGVGDGDQLVYPFRDDTLLLWQAINDHVGKYLALYYPGDQQVVEDFELQAWISEICSPQGSGMRGFEPFLDSLGRIARVDDLARILSYVLYIAGPQHASANYGMYDFEGFMPSCSLSLWAPPPTASSVEDISTYVGRMPPVDIALYQCQFSYLLSRQRFGTFGQYAEGTFSDPRALELNAGLAKRLGVIEATIEDRNRGRFAPYLLQLPSRIPNSISI